MVDETLEWSEVAVNAFTLYSAGSQKAIRKVNGLCNYFDI